ncbi:FAD-dependent oxidoreductase [Parafrankia discariae]|uniref:FAD-dependent oxidoreductase n=1 Tax=Parafrankia discariae TaxID=365528 RepID=UPI0003811FC0|nr:tryptophan 7-halogenase [Parafrankia discariae]
MTAPGGGSVPGAGGGTAGGGAGPGRRGHAVVLGASVAGLLAARVLAEHVGQVTIIDRDDVTATATPTATGTGGARGGAAQGRHLHALMERGRQILDELYPDFTAKIAADGVPTAETLVGTRWYFDGARVTPVPTGLTSVLASRPALEAALRAATLGHDRIRWLPELRAVGLVRDAEPAARDGAVRGRAVGGRVAGVRVEPLAGDTPARALEADLVVDATGRGSRAVEWLTDLGFDVPRAETVGVDLAYASRTYRRRPTDLGGDLGVIISTLPGTRGGGAVAQEGDRWIVTLAGMLGDHPPVDAPGYERFAASLPAPDIHRLIQGAEPLDDPVRYRFRASRRLRYDLLRSPAAGFVAIGDALCTLNPLYAQGMTVAAQQALELRGCLRSGGLDNLAARYFAAAAQPTSRAWSIATDSDLRYREVEGRRGPRTRITNAYIPRVQAATRSDPVLARNLIRVVNLVDPPTILLTPAALLRTARHALTRHGQS